MRNLITAQEVIDLAFAENSNMMAESISDTSIRIAEIKYIRPAFGAMYTLLADKYADYTNDYVKPALAYFVKCEIVSSIAIDMSNSGVAVANPQYQSAATDKQRQRLYDSEMSKAKTLLDFALEYIATHSEEFPDFSGEAPKKHHRVGGILLGDGTSRSQSASVAGEAFRDKYEGYIRDMQNIKDEVETLSQDVEDAIDDSREATSSAVTATNNAKAATSQALNATASTNMATKNANNAATKAMQSAEDAESAVANLEEYKQGIEKQIANKVDKVAGKGLSTNDYTDTEKAKVAEIDGLKQSIEGKANTNGTYPNMTVGTAQGVVGINQVQEALTLTTKSNGNIVIGNLAGQSKEFMPATPSGDPMHYVYEAAGATWNANTGYWKMYTLTDVTNEQMRAAVARGAITCGEKQPLCNSYRSLNDIRFNLSRAGNYIVYLSTDSVEYYAYANETIEVINLTFYKNLGSQYDGAGLNVASLNHAFSGCSKLRQILGKILLSGSSINTTNAFKGCTSLEDLRLAALVANVSFADSPIDVASATYMIANADASATFTITFRADRQAIFEANSDFIDAKSAKPNITIMYK